MRLYPSFNTPQYNDFMAANLRLGAGAAAPTWTTHTTNLGGWGFSASATNEIWDSIEILHGWQEGTSVQLHMHWVASTNNVGNIVINFDYSWTNANATNAATTNLPVTIASPGVADQHVITNLGSPISGTGKTIGSLFQYRFQRLGGDGADTYTGLLILKNISLHVKMDTLGSNGIITK